MYELGSQFGKTRNVQILAVQKEQPILIGGTQLIMNIRSCLSRIIRSPTPYLQTPLAEQPKDPLDHY
jgi:hypothetical protein